MARGILPVALAAAASMWANDTAATLGAGGLEAVKAEGIAIEAEDLRISLSQVSVRYRFRNTTDRDLETLVAFPLPPLNGGDLANIPIRLPSGDALNFVGFAVEVDGKPVSPQVEVRSYFGDVEITAALRARGIPLSARDVAGVTAAIGRLSQKERAELQRLEWVDCGLTRDGRCWPYWQSRIQYYWKQRFPARATVAVTHTYRPVVGGGAIPASSDAARLLAPYCGGEEARAALQRWQAAPRATADADRPAAWEQRVHYILTTANNWKGPIGHFRLTVSTDAPEDVVSTCLPGLRRAAPTRYEFERRDYRPDRDLELQILQRAK